MRKFITVLVLLAVTFAGSAFAQTIADDLLKLAQKNVGEEVMLAFVEASNSAIELSAADIITLKEAKVPDKVIVAMLRHHPAARPASQPQLAKENKPEQIITRTRESNSSGDNPVVIDRRPAPAPVVVETPAPTVVYDTPPVVYTDYAPVVYSGYYYPGYVWPGLGLSFGFGGWYGGGYHGGYGGYYHGGYGGGYHGGYGGGERQVAAFVLDGQEAAARVA